VGGPISDFSGEREMYRGGEAPVKERARERESSAERQMKGRKERQREGIRTDERDR
jgi:hypothetical protein